jgi:hypothetical protein
MKKLLLILLLLPLLTYGQRVSDLPAASTLTGTELVPGVQSSTSKKITLSQIRTYVLSGAGGSVTSVATTSPITGGTITSTGTIAINNAAADGSTKGAASFTAADFNASSGLISIDYTNGQAASTSNKGLLSAADWNTFNTKLNKKYDYTVKTSNYQPVAADTLTNKVFLMHSTGALTFTVPAFTTLNFKKGTSFFIIGDSTGVTTITAASGVQFESSGTAPFTLTGDQYAIVSKRNTTNTWDVFIGDEATGMTNPMTTAADIIVGGVSGAPARLGKGTALQVLRTNSGATALEWATASGGITNGAAANEIPKSDGTNIVASGIGSPSTGNLDLGLSGTAGSSRTVQAVGSASAIDAHFAAKGAASVYLDAPNVYANGTTNFYLYGVTNPTMWVGQPGTTNGYIRGQTGQSGTPNGTSLNITGGAGYTVSGNNNGGDVSITSGAKRASGTDGNITINALTGYLILSNIPTSSAGLPSGAVWSNLGILTIVP